MRRGGVARVTKIHLVGGRALYDIQYILDHRQEHPYLALGHSVIGVVVSFWIAFGFLFGFLLDSFLGLLVDSFFDSFLDSLLLLEFTEFLVYYYFLSEFLVYSYYLSVFFPYSDFF
jgi:hypothetical protein